MASLYFRTDLDRVNEGDLIALDGPELTHAVTVARVRAGEHLMIGDGRGLLINGVVVEAHSRALTVRSERVQFVDRPELKITLVQALAKGDRDERAVQASTELGVDDIVPWSASRSVSRWEGPKLSRGQQRWSTIAREASKQSIRAWIPRVGDLVTTQGIAALGSTQRVLVLEPTAETALTELSFDDRSIALVVGPEGGVTPEEHRILCAAGAISVRLGSTVLRTSTAGPAALTALSVLLHRW